MSKGGKFNAKILLFGEYALMVGSQALSIPYFDRFGKFVQSSVSEADKKSREYLKQFLQYLKTKTGIFSFSIEAFENDLEQGLAFETNIPVGYGLGSSGALVAAVYDRYAIQKSEDLSILKKIFSEMEAFFHGKSSGLDPLVCYLKKPVWVKSPDEVTIAPENNLSRQGENALFLIDSQQSGETGPLVNYFTRRYINPDYVSQIQLEVIPTNNTCITSWLNNDTESLFPAVKNLSEMTLDLFSPMIPKGFEDIWKKGIESDHYSLKLCGSGGGGMILGFTRDFETVQNELGQFPLYLIQRF